ncbi:hypothetical protein DSL64_15800 [Dyadobacter luteus]|uniref:Uncharacterized protein n=1 Tax=Dyadobacter luteus TaxID=2259619 RepID=A0A3D8Y9I7_9BACT|nr:hypothetical protein DSL64_15800 [Dyadobacter luteus]
MTDSITCAFLVGQLNLGGEIVKKRGSILFPRFKYYPKFTYNQDLYPEIFDSRCGFAEMT